MSSLLKKVIIVKSGAPVPLAQAHMSLVTGLTSLSKSFGGLLATAHISIPLVSGLGMKEKTGV